jgi:hypothetical protein
MLLHILPHVPFFFVDVMLDQLLNGGRRVLSQPLPFSAAYPVWAAAYSMGEVVTL